MSGALLAAERIFRLMQAFTRDARAGRRDRVEGCAWEQRLLAAQVPRFLVSVQPLLASRFRNRPPRRAARSCYRLGGAGARPTGAA